MKPRIKQLADEAQKYAEKQQNDIHRIYKLDCMLQKFAELVIEECHQVIVVGGVDDLDGVMKHFEIE